MQSCQLVAVGLCLARCRVDPGRRRGRARRHHGRVDAEDFRQIRDAVRQLVRESVIPREEQIEDEDRIPDDLRAQAADMGLFGYALPEAYGGLGVTMSEDVQLAMEFGYTTPAFRSLFGTNNGIAGQVIARFGSDEQKKSYLPRLAAGELIGSFALTEAEAGSDPAGLRTTARRDGDEWVINGSKRSSSSRPPRPASPWAPRTRRWASRVPGRPRSSSTTSACRPMRSSARR